MKILVAAHDAGGAEVVSAWVRANPEHNYYYLLQGPAVAIFSRKLTQLHNYSIKELPLLLTKVNFVLTGTSWASDLEKRVIKEAHVYSACLPVASYLDHWCNYLERFLYEGINRFPDGIWVGDKDAEDMARNFFKEIPIRLVPNQYFVDFKCEFERELEKIELSKSSEKINVLYICEPVAKVNNTYTEFSALSYFFERILALELLNKLSCIKLRLHPSEEKGKYDSFVSNAMKQYPGLTEIVFSEGRTTLAQDCVWANWVVGISSMALAMANFVDKKVFTCVPEGAVVTQLPHMCNFDKSLVENALSEITPIFKPVP